MNTTLSLPLHKLILSPMDIRSRWYWKKVPTLNLETRIPSIQTWKWPEFKDNQKFSHTESLHTSTDAITADLNLDKLHAKHQEVSLYRHKTRDATNWMWNVSADLTHGGGSVAFYYRNSVKRKQMNCATCLAMFGLMHCKTDLTSDMGSRDLSSPEYYCLFYTPN
jgi:hypothetical protein